MVAITRALAASDAGGRSVRSSPELDANLRTCRAQLADWVTCPSAKTPPGKAKITQITAKLDSIKAQIETNSDVAASADPDPRKDGLGRSTAVKAAGEVGDYPGSAVRLGLHLDTYA